MLKTFVALTALAAAGSVHANIVTLFEDDFDSYAEETGITTSIGSKWTVNGNVDILQSGTFGISCDGNCVDLAGTPGPGQITSNVIAMRAGKPVKISFDVSGNQRLATLDQIGFRVVFLPSMRHLGATYQFPGFPPGEFAPGVNSSFLFRNFIAGDSGRQNAFIAFTPVRPASMRLEFFNQFSRSSGPLLDNVLVTQVPEPATWAMLIAGFGLVGVAARRRGRAAQA